MTRSIKIAACRIAFVMFCFVPLVGSISYAAWQRWADSDSIAAAWIASRLGTRAEVQALRASKPGVETAHSIKLLDPETGKLIAVCRDVQIQRGPAAQVVSIASADVPPGRMMALWRILHDRVLRQAELLETALIVNVDRLALRDRGGEVEIDGLRIESQRTPRGARAAISFRPARDLERRPVRIDLFRDQAAELPSTRLEIQSHDQALDCSLVTGSPDWLQRFGDAVHFQGVAWLQLHSRDWHGEITGRIHGVQIDRLSAAGLLPPMTGIATLENLHAEFTGHRLVSGSADLFVGPGAISAIALQSLETLGLTPSLASSSAAPNLVPDAMLEYDTVGVLVHLDASGVTLSGILDPKEQRIAISRDDTAILRGAAAEPVPVAALIEWVTGRAIPGALFTEAGAALYDVLPLMGD